MICMYSVCNDREGMLQLVETTWAIWDSHHFCISCSPHSSMKRLNHGLIVELYFGSYSIDRWPTLIVRVEEDELAIALPAVHSELPSRPC